MTGEVPKTDHKWLVYAAAVVAIGAVAAYKAWPTMTLLVAGEAASPMDHGPTESACQPACGGEHHGFPRMTSTSSPHVPVTMKSRLLREYESQQAKTNRMADDPRVTPRMLQAQAREEKAARLRWEAKHPNEAAR